jgi:hypothetical protein
MLNERMPYMDKLAALSQERALHTQNAMDSFESIRELGLKTNSDDDSFFSGLFKKKKK